MPYEFKGANAFMLTFDMTSKDLPQKGLDELLKDCEFEHHALEFSSVFLFPVILCAGSRTFFSKKARRSAVACHGEDL